MRLDELKHEVGDTLEVEWRAFLLRPFAQERSLDAFTRYTEGWARPAASEPGTEFRTWSGEHAPPSHSMPCAIAGKAVMKLFGAAAFDRFHLALMRAYFTDNRTISDASVVLEAAAACDLDTAELAPALKDADGLYEVDVITDHRAALALGIAAVPTVVVDDEHILQGALALDQYRKVVARLAS